MMGRLCEFLAAFELFDEGLGLILRGTRPAGNRVFGAAITYDILKNLHGSGDRRKPPLDQGKLQKAKGRALGPAFPNLI